ncbi:hypothetical protein [Burkholderia sp. Bp8963]|uniref:hypothetical protein n=1 Tax=Burkholderia sp. Bp8963 TaxID=2184547 RepID=UPI0021AB4C30|nr:hypothetical protein [Burkholderia sp. Bp8963]
MPFFASTAGSDAANALKCIADNRVSTTSRLMTESSKRKQGHAEMRSDPVACPRHEFAM